MIIARRLGPPLLACLILAGCGFADDAGRAVERYGDDAGRAVERYGDDAARQAEDAARAARAAEEAARAADAAAQLWKTSIGAKADSLAAAWFEQPDDAARARSYVVGTAC